MTEIKNHKHCPYCGEVMGVDDNYCSEECAHNDAVEDYYDMFQ